ncbi:unnamed protein product, partial [Rotaria sp. Silwood2]
MQTNANERETRQIQLTIKYEIRGLIHLDIAKKFNYVCFNQFNHFTKSKSDFTQYQKLINEKSDIRSDKKNFIQLFKRAFSTKNNSSIGLYDECLKINPYFFEAQYQILLNFYELNDCTTVYHLHDSFNKHFKSNRSIEGLFEVLINHRNASKSIFMNKVLKIKVRNNQRKPLYLQFIYTENSYQLKFNNKEQLINLLKYGHKSLVLMKKNSNKSLRLKYQLSNSDFQ